MLAIGTPHLIIGDNSLNRRGAAGRCVDHAYADGDQACVYKPRPRGRTEPFHLTSWMRTHT